MNDTMDSYQLLSNAIILQAIDDYKKNPKIIAAREKKLHKLKQVLEAVKKTGIENDIKKAAARVEKAEKSIMLAKEDQRDIERFFRSSWYRMLTNVDGEIILNYLHKEVRA